MAEITTKSIAEQRCELVVERDNLRNAIISNNYIGLLREAASELRGKGYRLQPLGLEALALKIQHLREIDNDIEICDGMALPKKVAV